MDVISASRTLVKSPPELWSECSDSASLARHLGRFGEIRVTRLEPESAVAWEGEEFSGTVRLEPAGWGTKVILTAHPADADEVPELDLAPPPRTGILVRLRALLRPRAAPADGRLEPDSAQPEAEPPPEQARLVEALDSLGTAHHRPFSRG